MSKGEIYNEKQAYAFDLVDQLGFELELADCTKEKAIKLLGDCWSRYKLNHSLDLMLLSILYIVLKQENSNIAISDFAIRSNRQQREIRRVVNTLVRKLGLSLPPPNYKSIILRYSNYFTIDHNLLQS